MKVGMTVAMMDGMTVDKLEYWMVGTKAAVMDSHWAESLADVRVHRLAVMMVDVRVVLMAVPSVLRMVDWMVWYSVVRMVASLAGQSVQ